MKMLKLVERKLFKDLFKTFLKELRNDYKLKQ